MKKYEILRAEGITEVQNTDSNGKTTTVMIAAKANLLAMLIGE